MKKLRKEFRKNDMFYTIIERTENYYFAKVETQKGTKRPHWECGRIM